MPMMTNAMRAPGSSGKMASVDSVSRTGAPNIPVKGGVARPDEVLTLLPYKPMAARITLVRHAETAANVAGRWQGATDTAFSQRGRDQLSRLAARLRSDIPAVVIASDLARAASSAAALGLAFEPDARWREPNVGEWEGLTFEEIRARDADRLAALMNGEDVAIGGGERLSDVAARLSAAFADVVARVGEDGSAVVVSHGLALLTLVSSIVGTRRPAPLQLMGNTGVTSFSVNSVGPQLVGYNDTSHLDDHPTVRAGETTVLLVRHGETIANVERRWQGHTDWPLTRDGEDQAAGVGAVLPPLDAVYSSPLIRARQTALAIADHHRLPLHEDDRLKEIGFGEWENLTRAEVESADPVRLARLAAGEDVVRGTTGETFLGVRGRMTEAIESIAARHEGGTVAVVSHGGASRAYLTGLLGVNFAARNRVGSLDNTAFGRIVYGRRGPILASWNARPHLEAAGGTPQEPPPT